MPAHARFSIRALDPGEWEVLKDLRIRALSDAPDAFAPTAEDARGRGDGYWRELLERAVETGARVLIALDGERTVGIVAARVDAEGVGHVGAMWVDPAARGTGLGRRLVAAALDALDARGCRRVELSVTEGNERAAHLYESFGFAYTGEREPLREGSPLDNLTMARET